MLDVFLLLAVARRLFQSLDDEGGGGRNDRDCCLAILNRKFDGYAEAFLEKYK